MTTPRPTAVPRDKPHGEDRTVIPPSLGAVVLAAGASSRLGRPKQAVRLNGAPLAARSAEAARAVATGPCVVVTGAHRRATEAALDGVPVPMVHNPHWQRGLSSSLRAGLEAVGPVDALLVLLCDQWAVEADDLGRLVAAWAGAPGHIAASRWAQASGPPAIFPARLFGALAALTGDAGARALIASPAEDVTFVDMPSAALELDDGDDLAAMRAAEKDGWGAR